MAENKKGTPIAKAMPFNNEAEQSLLACMLIDGNAADDLIPTLQESDFFIKAHKTIFSAIAELHSKNCGIETLTVVDLLERKGFLEDVGGAQYIISLSDAIPSAAMAEEVANIVKRDALTRKVITAANQIIENAYSSDSGTDALNFAERTIFSIAEDVTDHSLKPASKSLEATMERIAHAQLYGVSEGAVRTGFDSLDMLTGGFKPGELILLAARPSVGKTAFALNIASNVCLQAKKTVAIFSLEMPAHLLLKRMLAHVSKVPLVNMDRERGLSTDHNARLLNAYAHIHEASLYIDDYSLNNPSNILSKCRKLKREHGLDLIIVDYLQLMTTGKSDSNRQQAVSDMSRSMKLYAGELGVPIILLSQMSRRIEQDEDHIPKLSDLRESGAIEQDADMVMFLHKPSNYTPGIATDLVQLLIRKNRNGNIGDIDLSWNGETTSFTVRTKEESAADKIAVKDSAKSGKESKKVEQSKEDNRKIPSAKEIYDQAEEQPEEEASELEGEEMPFPLEESAQTDDNLEANDELPWHEEVEESIWDGEAEDEYVDPDDDDDGELVF